MIKFFRKIRQQLLTENPPAGRAGKFSKPASPAGRYLIYAIGEILLVVIGILIALQMNNWNETRKQTNKTNHYISSLFEDLNENLKYLQRRNTEIRTDLKNIQKIGDRISKTNATLDTVTKISREEVSLMFYTFSNLNENTYQTLLNTGHIEYLDQWLQKELQQLSFMENDLMKINDKMSDDHSQVLIDFIKVYPMNKHGHIISENLADKVLDNLSEAEKISSLNSFLWIKGGVYNSILRRSEPLEEKTLWLMDSLKTLYPLLNE